MKTNHQAQWYTHGTEVHRELMVSVRAVRCKLPFKGKNLAREFTTYRVFYGKNYQAPALSLDEAKAWIEERRARREKRLTQTCAHARLRARATKESHGVFDNPETFESFVLAPLVNAMTNPALGEARYVAECHP